jgi:hypothetical protein
MNDPQLVQIVLNGLAGAFGVGATWATVRGKLKSLEKDVEEMKLRQKRLRGEDNGGVPVFISKDVCETTRDACSVESHTKTIKALENFARWILQDRGLSVAEINRILGTND